jgi:hypothetical protein
MPDAPLPAFPARTDDREQADRAERSARCGWWRDQLADPAGLAGWLLDLLTR